MTGLQPSSFPHQLTCGFDSAARSPTMRLITRARRPLPTAGVACPVTVRHRMGSPSKILAVALLFVAGCDQADDRGADTTPSPDNHQEAVARFQAGQRRFKELIATVRDERSFDAAKPELDKVVSDWREVAATLRGLEPPSETRQAEIRALIAKGHRAAEPTGEDMLGLISIESREAEITRWFEEFAAAGGAAGAEMVRLYGPTDYSNQ